MTVFELETESREVARDALRTAMQLQDDGHLVVHDAALLDGDEVVATLNPAAFAAAVPSALIGALVGTLVAGPLGMLVGGIVGGSSGALTAKLADTGLPHHLLHKLRRRRGEYTALLLVSERDAAGAEDTLRRALADRGQVRSAPIVVDRV